MVTQIIWNKRAKKVFSEIIDYLEEEFSDKTAANFVKKVFTKLEILRKYPEMGRKSKKRKTVRQIKVDKYRKMFYRLHGRKLYVCYFFDTRQDPDKNPY